MADRAGWQRTLEAELRAAGRHLDVPPAGDPTAAVRQRLEGPAGGRRRVLTVARRRLERRAARRHAPAPGAGMLRRPALRAVAVVVVAILAALIATPQGRAVVVHVLRFAGVELRQEPGPPRTPGGGSLPGEHRVSLDQARREVSFPILVPAALGRPGEVTVSDRGRVVSLIYRRAPYGLVRLDEYAGRFDALIFQKFVPSRDLTPVRVNGTQGMWIKGPHELVYLTRGGIPVMASARLTTGNTLVWGTRRVAVRLEGDLAKATALAIADSAR